jgi:hypothetical protein
MTTIQTRARVDKDGNLSITLPLDPADAGREVVVTVSPAEISRADLPGEQWLRVIEETAGSITDPTFARPPQPVLEPAPELTSGGWQPQRD